MRLAAPAIALFIGISPGLAEPVSDIANCAAMPGDLDRLQCYDDLAVALKADGPQPVPVASPATTGAWVVGRTKNPIDDTETVTAMLMADQGESRYGGRVAFFARCLSNSTEAYIAWDDYLASDGDYRSNYKNVTVRIGAEPASVERWSVSTDSKATFAPGWGGDLLKRMLSANSFVAQVTPYNESPTTAIFNTSGMRTAIAPIAEVCKWELP